MLAHELLDTKALMSIVGIGVIHLQNMLMVYDRIKMQHRLKPFAMPFGRNIWLAIVFVLFVCFGVKDVLSHMDSIIYPCKSETYISIDSLYAYCGLPGICGKPLACEGQTALIQGDTDYGNVFDKTAYPMLPYQKFLITNVEHRKTMEVWVDSEGSEAVFRKIAEKRACNPDGPVYVKGVLVGFDMPIMGTCYRDLKLNLTAATLISYDCDGLLPKKTVTCRKRCRRNETAD